MKTIENMNMNEVVITNEEADAILLQAFDHAISTIANEGTKAAAFRLAKSYFGEDTAENSIAGTLMNGFYMGVHEGMRIMAALNGDDEYLAQCDHIEE